MDNPVFESSKPQFNAINGEELKKVILRELDRKLSAYDEFRQHLTYSKFMYLVNLEVAIDAYPLTKTLKVGAMAEGKSEGYSPDPGAKPRRWTVSWGTDKAVTKPDQLRQEAGLDVPKTTVLDDGQIVDKPIK